MLALHYLLPFVILCGLVVHLGMLHVMGSGSASTVPGGVLDGEPFLVYYYKDIHQQVHVGRVYTVEVILVVAL